MSDLSEYEKKRLENIKRNAAFLAQLGFDPVVVKHENEASKDKKETYKKPVQKKRKLVDEVVYPTRSSQRLRSMDAEVAARKLTEDEVESPQKTKQVAQSSSGDESIDYELMPESSEELDDHEFQVYVILRSWRLKTSRELDIEPYKVCQNRTIAELVRRRRNYEKWARSGHISADLLECWGIGPSKARPDGFGAQMAELMDSNEDVETHLRASRDGKVSGAPDVGTSSQVEIKDETEK